MKLLSVLALVGLSSAAAVSRANEIGVANVDNHCNVPIYLQYVRPGTNPTVTATIAPGGSWGKPLLHEGIAIKVSPEQSLASQTDFAFSVTNGLAYVSLSDVGGDPFEGHKVSVVSTNGAGVNVQWPNGVPTQTGPETQTCPASADVTLTLC